MERKNMYLCDLCFEPIESGTTCSHCDATYKPTPNALKVGTHLADKYIIGKVLVEDHSEIIYLAYSLQHEKAVALKEFYPSHIVSRASDGNTVLLTSEDKRNEFEKKSNNFLELPKIIAPFSNNENIISIYEVLYANDTVYYSMEYSEGRNLRQYIADSGGYLSESEAIMIMKALCDALISIHAKNILCRYICPDNILITNDKTVKLIDFTLAKRKDDISEHSLLPIIEPHYAPIEFYNNRYPQDERADIYSLGASMYYAVTGDKPEEVLSRLEKPEISFDPTLDISPEFINIIKTCMEIKAENRYQSAMNLWEALCKVADSSDIDERNTICGFLEVNPNLFMNVDSFDASDNFIPCIYGSPEQITKNTKDNKLNNKLLPWLWVLLGMSISALICILLILFF